MPGLGSGAAADPLDDPIRGEAARLVDDEPAVKTAISRHRRRSSASATCGVQVALDLGPGSRAEIRSA